jgi:hypothetical protein
MDHRTLQMLLKHYWRWIPTDDLSAEEMSSLESAATPLASNHAHLLPTRPQIGSPGACKTMKKPNKTGGEGGIRTLGTGYPVLQISNVASVWGRSSSNKTD